MRRDTPTWTESLPSSSPLQSFQPNPTFLEAIRHGDARRIRQELATCPASVCAWRDADANTLLHYASMLGTSECLVELLQSRVVFSFVPNVCGQTPLHVAGLCARTITPVLLLVAKYGPTPLRDGQGSTFVHILLSNTYLEEAQVTLIMESLLRRPAVKNLVNERNADGLTLYDVAYTYHGNNPSLLQLLLSCGAVSGALLFQDEAENLFAAEDEQREDWTTGEEEAYAGLCEEAAADRERIHRNRHARRKLTERERRKRERLAEREEASRGKLQNREAKAARLLVQRLAALDCAARLLQRVGRGCTARCVVHQLLERWREEQRARFEAEAAQMAVDEGTARTATAGEETVARAALGEAAQAAVAEIAARLAAAREERLRLAREKEEEAAESAKQLAREAALIEERAARLVEEEGTAAPKNTAAIVAEEEAVAPSAEALLPTSLLSRLPPTPPALQKLHLLSLPENLLVYLQSVARMRLRRRRFLQRRASCVAIQRAWRHHEALMRRRREEAADMLLNELRKVQLSDTIRSYVRASTTVHIEAVLKEIMRLVTQMVWRENFCSAFRDIIFMQKRRAPLPPLPPSRLQRLRRLSQEMEPFVLLAQVVVSLFLLIYMGCVPRTAATKVHNKVDIAFICVEIALSCGMPMCWWRVWDLAVTATALVCAATGRYGGAIVITLFVMKLPFVVRAFAPRHSGTRTYCRAIEYSVVYLLTFLPFGLAGIGSTVRGTALNDWLLTDEGNWGRVLLRLLSTVSPQYTLLFRTNHTASAPVDLESLVPLRAQKKDFDLGNGELLLFLQMPLVQLIFFQSALWLYTWMAVVVGVHNAIRHHYDVSDETKLKLNRHRFHNEGKEELFDAHRATNIETLGQQLDGVMWEDDIRAAKEAVDASHYDHNTNFTVHRFVRRVQDSLSNQGNTATSVAVRAYTATAAASSPVTASQPMKESRKWDCRNEDPQSRGSYDVEVIETALGMSERKTFGERVVQRQWTGALLRKEMNLVVVGMLVMATVKPNLYEMEVAFSAVFAVELLLSLYFLRVEFILSHYVRLVLRIFCIVVGFVPHAVPFVVFRFLRLVEGWSQVFNVPGMVRWAMLYLLLSFVTVWMIAFVAALQVLAVARLGKRESICSSRNNCLAITIRELALPAFTPEHIDPTTEAPVMAMMVLFSHICFIPFFLAIVLHPLLRLSNFIGRFLRLVVQSLHKDVVDYLENYLEGASWYTHWHVRSLISVGSIVRLKMWLNDMRRRRITDAWNAVRNGMLSSFFAPQKTFVKGYEATPDAAAAATVLTEIICRGEFASFEENSALDGFKYSSNAWSPARFAIRNVYVHCANAVLTFTSIAFLWVADASLARGDARVVLSSVFHVASLVLSLVVIPRDSTAVMTLVSAGALFTAVVLVLLPGARYRGYYCLRFVSLLRLGQLQVFPFRDTKRLVKMYIDSAVKILLPAAVIGGLAHIAELLRAQILMVQFDRQAYAGLNWSNASEVAALRANVSYEDFLAAVPRDHKSRPNVQQTSDLFSEYFGDDAFIFYSIFSFWVLPAMCISTCLSYLFWIGTNLRDTNRLMIDTIPSWEDPITISGVSWYQWLYRYVGNVILLASLVFGCIFSPTTSATANDFRFFLGFEVGFTMCGLAEAILSSSFAVHRCGRSSASWRACEKDAKHPHVLLGDCILLLCEMVQLLYYCIAVALCSTLLVEHTSCLISLDAYATYFITLRFVFLLRLLSREFLLSLMGTMLSTGFGAAGIIVFFVGSASAMADVYASETRTAFSTATWRAAFDSILRLTFTSAIPAEFAPYWTPFNATAAADAMRNASLTLYVVDENFTTSRLAFVLATACKALLASIAGLVIGAVAVPVRSYFLQPLPAKSYLLYRTLCGGLRALVKFGMRHHDDMRPQARRRIQARKFARLFTPEGIPSWAVPHLLEELDICRPVRQRRFMYAFTRLLEYLPTAERRQECVREYMHMWDTYRCGGPAHLRFSELPVYPPPPVADAAPNPYASAPAANTESEVRRQRYIAPLRLVQALAIFELGFPADSSVGSKLWMDFFSVVQKMRGATLMQSLWRMYREEKDFDADPSRSPYDRALIAYLRRSFRRHKLRNCIQFLSFTTFQEALKYEREALNPDTGHFDIMNRLRGHFNKLQLPGDFWKSWRAAEAKKAV